MNLNLDQWIILTGTVSFINFFILHVVFLRFAASEKVLKWLMNCVWIALAGHMAFLFLCLQDSHRLLPALGIVAEIVWALLSLTIFFLLVFFYVLCIFGPSETSVRFRLIEELASAKDKGMNLKEILSSYNAQEILGLRLKRLQEAGDIAFDNGKYYLKKKQNIFFRIDSMAQKLKQWIE